MKQTIIIAVALVAVLASFIITAQRTQAYEQKLSAQTEQIETLQRKLKSRDTLVKAMTATMEAMSRPEQAIEYLPVHVPKVPIQPLIRTSLPNVESEPASTLR